MFTIRKLFALQLKRPGVQVARRNEKTTLSNVILTFFCTLHIDPIRRKDYGYSAVQISLPNKHRVVSNQRCVELLP